MKLPHWHAATLGLHIGRAKFAHYDHYGVATLSDMAFKQTVRAHMQMMVALHLLEDFSTRDYLFDRGGMTITEAEMQAFCLVVWAREGKA